MPDVTKDQLCRLQSATEEIQRVIAEIAAVMREESAVAHPPLARHAAVSGGPPAGIDCDDIIVDCEPE